MTPGGGLRHGQRNDVVLDVEAGVVRRYPRTAAALADLDLSAARVAAARAVGLPAPEVLEVVPGPLGSAHLVMRLLGGEGLSPQLTARLDPSARRQLVADLVALLGLLRDARTAGWPGHPLPWTDRWAALGNRLRGEVLPLIEDDAGGRLAVRQIAAAEVAARTAATRGLAHGDLGGENVHVDPLTGAVIGVLDWDDAAPGDPAVDLAAVRVHAEPWLAEALLVADPSLRELVARAEAYVGTFALQQALWGLESGDPDEVAAGLSPYRSVRSSPRETSSTSSPSAASASRTTAKASPEE